jgi:hypothetical protein
MGKYLQAAGLNGLYVDDNDARRSVNTLYREWNDLNGNRVIDCDLSNPAPHTLPGGDTCGTHFDTNGELSPDFVAFGRPPSSAAAENVICGRFEGASQLQRAYCEEAGQNLLTGWGKRRYEWQFGLGIQHEVRPGLVGEVTYNRRTYGNLTATDTLLVGCDFYGPRAAVEDYQTCASRHLDYESDLYDFYSLTAPVDPRLPGGGGYVVRGNRNQKAPGSLPAGAGDVTLVRDELGYYWHGIDTNISLRAARGLRVSAGTSTGRAVRNACYADVDEPNVRGREGNEYAGGCLQRPRFQTNIRGSASYIVPWVDMLVSAVYQFQPGPPLRANLLHTSEAAIWDESSSNRQGTPFYPGRFQFANILDYGDQFGDNFHMWDMRLAKNLRFGAGRVSFGIDIFNMFNVDPGLLYFPNYNATLLPDGTWVEDNPATPNVEMNRWREVLSIPVPRHMKLSVRLDF